ncbi:MAG: DNA helicase RecQ [Anaerolineae bacterium]|nr:DNA helicase RecQ [Anaerolineae bacterium]
MKTEPASILKDTFGYNSFRPLQQEVINNVLARRDTLAVLPTGGGKSLCYQIPALIQTGLTVVVSPLIALMKDQVEQLRAAGVPAVVLNSTLSAEAYAANMEYVRRGQVKLLFVAPETLLTPRLFSLLDSVQVDLITIDEAHCISEWGHDFRPEYRQLVDVRRRYPKAVCLALTATATPRVRQDIKSSLGFAGSNEFVASFNRPNLYIEVAPREDALKQTETFLRRFKDQSGIIYCFSRRQVDDLAAYLTQKGYSARPYHAGLNDDERRRNQEAFIRDDVLIMVATIAFGMGINKPNVRFVLHYDLPKSIEGYYQEIGRAGRDGLPAHCLLLYHYSDAAKLRYFVDQKEGRERQVAMQHLEDILRYAEDTANCRRKPLLTYFGESYREDKCKNCDNCVATPPMLVNITIPAQKFMSCVKRTDERFGATYVIDVLRGSKAEKIINNGHDRVSTYGIGADMSKKQWMFLARQLARMGFLKQEDEFHTLSLTDKAMTALRQRSTIMGQMLSPLEETTAESRGEKYREPLYNHALFAILRQKRKSLADEAGLPPYVIFSDKTLVEMATYYPQSPQSLLNISGVGQVKARQYGEVFLEIIVSFCRKHDLEENKRREEEPVKIQSEPERPATRKGKGGSNRFVLVGQAYNAGDSLETLMQRYDVTLNTILDHLTRYVLNGNVLRQGKDLNLLTAVAPAERAEVFKVFEREGCSYLKPVFDALHGRVDYEDLKVLRLLYLVSTVQKS